MMEDNSTRGNRQKSQNPKAQNAQKAQKAQVSSNSNPQSKSKHDRGRTGPGGPKTPTPMAHAGPWRVSEQAPEASGGNLQGRVVDEADTRARAHAPSASAPPLTTPHSKGKQSAKAARRVGSNGTDTGTAASTKTTGNPRTHPMVLRNGKGGTPKGPQPARVETAHRKPDPSMDAGEGAEPNAPVTQAIDNAATKEAKDEQPNAPDNMLARLNELLASMRAMTVDNTTVVGSGNSAGNGRRLRRIGRLATTSIPPPALSAPAPAQSDPPPDPLSKSHPNSQPRSKPKSQAEAHQFVYDRDKHSDMIQAYISLYPSLKSLISQIKKWARPLGFYSDSPTGARTQDPEVSASWSSYSLACMAVAWCMHQGLLPNLQAGLPPLGGSSFARMSTHRGWDTRYRPANAESVQAEMHAIGRTMGPERRSVKQIFAEWVSFWAKFDFERQVVCIRLPGGIVDRKNREVREATHFEQLPPAAICVLHPFIRSKNCTVNIAPKTLEEFKANPSVQDKSIGTPFSARHSPSLFRTNGIGYTSTSESRPFVWKRHFRNTTAPCASSPARPLVTLKTAQLESTGQQILDISNTRYASVSVNGIQRGWQIHYILRDTAVFPSHAQGVLYYHHPGEIRFRLCQCVQEFGQGTDLLLPDGQTWSMVLPYILAKSSESQRSAILDLISDDHLSHSNWHILPGRHIATLSPANLSHMALVDLSGSQRPQLYFGPTGNAVGVPYYHSRGTGSGKLTHVPFPDGSVGVFYYKQSTFAPTRVGELRFRLCDNILSFEQGTDLLLPSGKVWHITADKLLLLPRYRILRDFLSTEGLLDYLLYPSTVCNASVGASVLPPHLLDFSQPFIVDLAQHYLAIQIWVGPRFESTTHSPIFRPPKSQGGKAAYRGRAVVRLEVPPSELLQDMTRNSKITPHFVLRFLEMLTPIEHDPECHNHSYMARPEPGQLHTVKYRGTYRPWRYASSSDEVYQHLRSFKQQSLEAPA
ncbi:hypothetical protein D9619_010453 [Psilocybe cf. subviscida]|uniref:Uncharacterized protein n=1 Tax=Psilocybe cf. subviscida TaxID=2480587 RepID=A0A8H5ASP4_9AGAR|nr:hypothetical protein D9619_010453 [Psilocybe cf. subviscida]